MTDTFEIKVIGQNGKECYTVRAQASIVITSEDKQTVHQIARMLAEHMSKNEVTK